MGFVMTIDTSAPAKPMTEREAQLLAACSLAAIGHPYAIPADHDWHSVAYEDVRLLYRKYEALRRALDARGVDPDEVLRAEGR